VRWLAKSDQSQITEPPVSTLFGGTTGLTGAGPVEADGAGATGVLLGAGTDGVWLGFDVGVSDGCGEVVSLGEGLGLGVSQL
jgi:hypothetical protein